MQELKHHYGSQVHIIHNPITSGLLARLCHPSTIQPDINRLVEELYTLLIQEVITNEFDKEVTSAITRMNESHPESSLSFERIQPEQKAVVVNLARAGTWPSHICYQQLHWFLNPSLIRQDHIFASRTTNNQNKVTGSELGGSKIGGDIENSFLIFPDPMGATGNTISDSINHYKSNIAGKPKKIIALHLIITPEYLKRITQQHPDVVIYALRLDRGLSPKAVLESVPGQNWNLERGLNDKDYIVPGGGGFGEIMNNSFV